MFCSITPEMLKDRRCFSVVTSSVALRLAWLASNDRPTPLCWFDYHKRQILGICPNVTLAAELTLSPSSNFDFVSLGMYKRPISKPELKKIVKAYTHLVQQGQKG